MKTFIHSVKGTRDFYPAEMAIRNWFYKHIRKVSESFGYQEYEGPFLEYLDLYAAKSGEELVKEQSYVFPDRGGELLTLRPELTPTLARMIAQRQRQLIYPLRWWSWGPFWRYERPQKGRSREFFQWNIDLIGVDTAAADAEMIAIVATFLESAGLPPSKVKIFINNRPLIEQEFDSLNLPIEMRKSVFHLIDRYDKMSNESWEKYATEIGLTEDQVYSLTNLLINHELWKKSERLQEIFELTNALGFGDYIAYSPQIIRGLDYYTGTVFEAKDISGKFRSILGGGRYDNLVEDVGGDPLPAVGFAMGDMVIRLILEKYNCLPKDIDRSPAQVLVTVFDKDTIRKSLELSTMLRNEGINVINYPKIAKLSKQFKFGDRIGVPIAVIIGPDEIDKGEIAIKDLRNGSQETVEYAKAHDFIKQLLENSISS
jgi:histidyl-tRNA synthetase